jgi:hypothetical protein
MIRAVEYLHQKWPETVIELRGDSHFASHEFMDWAHDKWYEFTMDSLIRRIMLSAVYIVEKKTYIKISFSPHHRHLEELVTALSRMAV